MLQSIVRKVKETLKHSHLTSWDHWVHLFGLNFVLDWLIQVLCTGLFSSTPDKPSSSWLPRLFSSAPRREIHFLLCLYSNDIEFLFFFGLSLILTLLEIDDTCWMWASEKRANYSVNGAEGNPRSFSVWWLTAPGVLWNLVKCLFAVKRIYLTTCFCFDIYIFFLFFQTQFKNPVAYL